MLEQINKLDVYIGLAIAGIFTGLGSALGNYFATKHLIEGTKKGINKIFKEKKEEI